MKTQLFTLAMLGSFAGLCSGCFQPLEEVENQQTESPSNLPQTTLKLNTRSATGVIDYPVLVLAYDADGNKSAQQVLSSADDQVKLKLPVGSYRLSAITGYSAYVQPEDFSTSDAVFSIPALGYATDPLFVGSADVDLGDKTATVEVLMSSRSSAMEISLYDLPSSVEATSIAVARQYANLGMDGTLALSTVARVDCAKSDDGVWSTGQFYVFPGSEAQTVLTITITDNQQQFSYGYTVNEPLKSAVPYIMKGSYKSGERVESFDLSGSLTVESWKDPKTYIFEFGEGASADGSASDNEIIDTEQVGTLPQSLTIWNGHVIALVVDQTDTEATLWLISKNEQTSVLSAYASGHENDALNLAQLYIEGDMTGWTIPSNYDMQELKKYYKDENMAYLNAVILQAGGTEIALKDGSKNVRYLCDNALQAIGFSSNSNIGKAGTSAKYSLRFIKKVHVSL